ncbi:hypothetical protein BGX23_002493 [Mortierella sp. AD031]|nr:hypothetical protein BGX23_002493 [Mortierella sp. AD031]KAG0219099.1 hypothetical protein BGX33_004669 [Mortierella sp. NVP41]
MSKDIERATLKKAAVSTLPLWAEQDQRLSLVLNDLPEEVSQEHDQMHAGGGSSSLNQLPLLGSPSASSSSSSGTVSEAGRSNNGNNNHSHSHSNRILHGAKSRNNLNSISTGGGGASNYSTLRQGTVAGTGTIGGGGGHRQDWSVFATMSNVSTLSELSRKYPSNTATSSSMVSPTSTLPTEPPQTAQSPDSNSAISSLRRFPQKLDELFKPRTSTEHGHGPTSPTGSSAGSNSSAATATPAAICTCTCPQHHSPQQQSSFFKRGNNRLGLSLSKRRNQKESMELMRGYPTGQCLSSAEPPESTNWDEKDAELPLTQGYGVAKNTAFNLDAIKGFLNSPLFSNFLKSLTVMAAVSLFAIALDAIVILTKASNNGNTKLSNDNAALIITVILSLLTIAYSCFTIFLESRRPPEGLDTSNSKPLFVIISEIIASIVWAQVLSITIYIYIWTYGCTEAGAEQLERMWRNQDSLPDHQLTDRLCRRQGAMVGLELLLVLLIIFNFYTHLAQNFKFIRAVS